MNRDELISKMAWAIRSRKHADACEQAREALAAVEQAGWKLTPPDGEGKPK